MSEYQMPTWLHVVIMILVVVAEFKFTQALFWEGNMSFAWTPSLNSIDPNERYEAARRVAEKYGGKK